MSAIANELNAIVVTATSPDRRIEGRVESMQYITLRFRHDSYEQHYRHRDVETLAHQLARGATLMATTYQKARREVMAAHGFERYSTRRPPFSSRHREYLERGARLTAYGSSSEQEVRIMAIGLLDFDVRIAPGVLDRCGERDFLRLADSAAKDLQAEHRRVHAELRHELHAKYKDRMW
ncbi:MAG TPA: hypothetical protein VN408_15240 [Actinoplanes sp.]|nr:hypothetical protein [Actinoplanes sp.]